MQFLVDRWYHLYHSHWIYHRQLKKKIDTIVESEQYTYNLCKPVIYVVLLCNIERITINNSNDKHIDSIMEHGPNSCSIIPCNVQITFVSFNGVNRKPSANIISENCKHNIIDKTTSLSVGIGGCLPGRKGL
jgi:hypothetical protein